MDLLTLLILLIVAGAVLYVIQLLPIDATMKRIAVVLVIVVVAIYVLKNFLGGFLSGFG